ncbi:MAG TPA: chemotaxis protein CheW [Saccharospirillum sp.]|nr:chemotaxis protein CheW [Saccharospirillum sp.]
MVKSTRTTEIKVSATDVALANYLDAMLHTATESDEARWPEADTESREAPAASAQPVEATVETPVPAETKPVSIPTQAPSPVSVQPEVLPASPARESVAEPKTAESGELPAFSPPEHELDLETPAVVSEDTATDESDLSRWLDNGRPVWAQQRFDCLVFVVDGLKLAVPLILLGNIHPLDRDLTPLFDQPEWFLGLLPVQNGRNLRVVDTARLVMPERYRPESVDDLAFGVGVYGSDWAFGCHQIEGSISLEPDAIKWRSSRTSRPWLAGTIIDRMCALVDLHEFARTAFKARSA